MVDKVIKNFSGSHEELMNLYKKAKNEVFHDEDLDLESLKVVELKALAKDRGIRGYSALRKAELIELLTLSAKTLDDS